MALEVVCAVVVVAVAYFLFVKSGKKAAKLPPGPKGIPIFGNALQLDVKKFASQLGDIGRNYKDAYTIKLYNKDIVVFNSYDMIKKVMLSKEYATTVSGHPPIFLATHFLKHDSALQTNTDEWSTLRHIMIRGLKLYGTNMSNVERLVQQELVQLLSRIENEGGNSVDAYDFITGYTTSIILMLTTGEHRAFSDPLMSLCSEVAAGTDYLLHPGVDGLLNKFPFLGYLPFGHGKHFMRFKENCNRLLQRILESRKVTMDRATCFMDFILEEQKSGHVTQENVFGVVIDLIAAGISTSRSSLSSLFLILATFPGIQRKIQEEIDQEIGQSRLPCAEDKHKMPYSQAVLWELFRYATPAPLTLPHTTIEDMTLGDYFLPENTMLFYNIWQVLHDETFWGNPWEFDPTRFLDEKGQFVPPENEKRHRMIAFGVGKRMCIGETLARLRVYLALITILQRFTILPDPKSPLPDSDPRTFDVNLLIAPPKYNVIFQPRH